MKKIILGSLAVLSLGLFSFTMPKPATGGVWRTNDGNYSIDRDACLSFTQEDQESVKDLMCKIYNVQADNGTIGVSPVPQARGGSVIDKYIFEFLIYTKFSRWDNAMIQEGTDQYNLLKVIDRYAQPMP